MTNENTSTENSNGQANGKPEEKADPKFMPDGKTPRFDTKTAEGKKNARPLFLAADKAYSKYEKAIATAEKAKAEWSDACKAIFEQVLNPSQRFTLNTEDYKSSLAGTEVSAGKKGDNYFLKKMGENTTTNM